MSPQDRQSGTLIDFVKPMGARQSCNAFLFVLICLISLSSASGADSVSEKGPLTVNVQLSIDYEGEAQPKPVQAANFFEVERVIGKLSKYVFVHLVNPAYFTAPTLEPQRMAEIIHSAIRPHHEVGLHIHPIEHLIHSAAKNYEKIFSEPAEIQFRNGPSFWSDKSVPRSGFYGDDVPFHSYNTKEASQIIRYSLHLLKRYGFKNISSFRANGWTSGQNIFPALIRNGIKVDTSAVPPEVIGGLYKDTNLEKIVENTWSGITQNTQPFRVNVAGQGSVEIHVNTLGLSDYLTAEKAFEQYLEILTEARKKGMKSVTIHYGLHLESASLIMKNGKAESTGYGQRVIDFIRMVEAHASRENIRLNPIGFEKFPKSEIRPAPPDVFRCLRGI